MTLSVKKRRTFGALEPNSSWDATVTADPAGLSFLLQKLYTQTNSSKLSGAFKSFDMICTVVVVGWNHNQLPDATWMYTSDM